MLARETQPNALNSTTIWVARTTRVFDYGMIFERWQTRANYVYLSCVETAPIPWSLCVSSVLCAWPSVCQTIWYRTVFLCLVWEGGGFWGWSAGMAHIKDIFGCSAGVVLSMAFSATIEFRPTMDTKAIRHSLFMGRVYRIKDVPTDNSYSGRWGFCRWRMGDETTKEPPIQLVFIQKYVFLCCGGISCRTDLCTRFIFLCWFSAFNKRIELGWATDGE